MQINRSLLAPATRDTFQSSPPTRLIMRITLLLLGLVGQTIAAALAQAEPVNVIGRWQIEITFENGPTRYLQFEARASGKGSLRVIVPPPNRVDSGAASAAEWRLGDDHSVMFRGPVAFPLGNVGIERGTLVLNGKLTEPGNSFAGTARLFPTDQDPDAPDAKPLKAGQFKATRPSD